MIDKKLGARGVPSVDFTEVLSTCGKIPTPFKGLLSPIFAIAPTPLCGVVWVETLGNLLLLTVE